MTVPDPNADLLDTLRTRILRGVHAGTLHEGDRLPSTRELGAEFAIDHRVVLAVYRQLADEGLVSLRARGGIYVAAQAGMGPGVVAPPETWLVDVLTEAFLRDISGPDVHDWLRRATETLRLRAAVITATADQHDGLCRELTTDFGIEADGLVVADVPGAGVLPLALRRADLLVTTTGLADVVHALGRRVRLPVLVLDVRADLVAGEWSLLLRRPVYVVVATPEFGAMVTSFLADTPGAENVRIVVASGDAGADGLAAIPRGAPTYVTQRVRSTLGTDGMAAIPGRVLPSVRTIAAQSARDLFAFIVRANLEAMGRRGRRGE